MAEKSTHYNLDILKGNDIYNPNIVFDDLEKIDTDMYNIDTNAVHSAVHILSGSVNTLTRTNTDFNIFKFVATAPYTVNQTFTVDGQQVSAYTTNGQPLENNCYVIGATVLCALNGSTLTLFVRSGGTVQNALKLNGHPDTYFAVKGDTSKTLKDVDDIATTALENSIKNVLWTNAQINNEFQKQIITINTTDYRYLLIVYIEYISTYPIYITDIVYGNKSVSPIVIIGSPFEIARRNIINITNTYIDFDDCYLYKPGTSIQTKNNSILIPYQIVGIK